MYDDSRQIFRHLLAIQDLFEGGNKDSFLSRERVLQKKVDREVYISLVLILHRLMPKQLVGTDSKFI